MPRRRMGEGSALRVMFGRAPKGSPMPGGCALVVLVVLYAAAVFCTVAAHASLGLL